MNAKRWISAMLTLTLALSAGLAGCGGQTAAEQPQTQEPTAQTQIEAVLETPEANAMSAADFTKAVDNANIDATTYLDYAAGIEAGVYK